MNQQCGSFNDIDTFTVTYLQQFYFTLILLFESESRAIKYCPANNAVLYQLVKGKSLMNQFPILRGNKHNNMLPTCT